MGVRRRRENRGIREEWGCQDLAAKANAGEVAMPVGGQGAERQGPARGNKARMQGQGRGK